MLQSKITVFFLPCLLLCSDAVYVIQPEGKQSAKSISQTAEGQRAQIEEETIQSRERTPDTR